jgi:hypothetical protein
MAVRVRYRANDLSEGVVETIDEANAFHIYDDNTLELRESWDDSRGDGTTVTRYMVVGEIPRDRWDSVVVLDHADA